MLTVSDIVSVTSSYMRYVLQLRHAAITLVRPGKTCRFFWSGKSDPLPICTMSRSHSRLWALCQAFYVAMQDEQPTLTCPFGVQMACSLVKVTEETFVVSAHTGFDPAAASDELVLSLPRQAKKTIKKALSDTSAALGQPSDPEEIPGPAAQVLETMVAGRMAGAMRQLAHGILTPIQGALADVDHVREGDTSAELVDRLAKNVAEINSTAKRMQVLLSQTVEPARQSLRRTRVHDVIWRVI